MYDYRRWTPEQQAAFVEERKMRRYPWHGPPHLHAAGEPRIVTGTCYEHQSILFTPRRLLEFEKELLLQVEQLRGMCTAWVVLPNHYHLLVQANDIKGFARGLGTLHGRTSYNWNIEDKTVGRKVWHRCLDRCMRSERHFYATLNYIHNNPVKHGYVSKWTDWPCSSVHWYLETKGREWLADCWREHPVLDYGATWDL